MKEILENHKGKALRCIHAIEKAMKVKWDLFPLDYYIKMHRKESNGRLDPLEEKLLDEHYKMLYKA